MLFTFVCFLYLFGTSYCVGRFFTDHFFRLLPVREYPVTHPVLYSFTGLGVIMVAASFWSLFLPVGLYFNLVLSLVALLCFFARRRSWKATSGLSFLKAHPWLLLFLLCTLLFVLVKASGIITNPDSGAYHLPIVRWTEQYGVVKGLANVHSRLGFNYQYLVLSAVYGFSFLGVPTLHAMNGYVMLLLLVYIVTSFDFLRSRQLSWLDLVRMCILFYVLNMSNAVPSFSPDAPTTFMIVAALLLLLEKMEEGRVARLDEKALLQLLLSIVAVLFKLSALPVLLFGLIYFVPVIRSLKTTLVLVLTVLLAFLPYFIRNYFISGYLVYPFYSLDLFHVPWKVPYKTAVYEKEIVRYFALGLPYGSEYDLKTAIVSWWKYLGISNRMYRYIVMVLLGCVAINLVWVLRTLLGGKVKEKRPYLLFFGLLYASLVYWFMLAPDPRFGNGFIVSFIATNLAFLLYPLLRHKGRVLLPAALSLLVLVEVVMISGYTLSKSYNNLVDKGPIYLLRQAPYPVPDTSAMPLSGNTKRYVVSDTSACWDCPLPCAYSADHYRMIGSSVKEGFLPAQ